MKIEVYTDGACSGNPGPGGWGAMIYVNDEIIQTLSGNSPNSTNNIMELSGPIAALSWIADQPEYVGQVVTIYSDSTYVIDSITKWIHGWIKNNFKGRANVELMKELYRLTYESELTVKYVKVPAHSGNVRNDAVDKLAVKERLIYA